MDRKTEHPTSHSLDHPHQETQQILNRMSRLIGHMESVRRMVEEGRDCSEVLIQLAAVRSAINSVGRIVLKDHIASCVLSAARSGDDTVLEELSAAVDQFLK